jgi:hypothetical protein
VSASALRGSASNRSRRLDAERARASRRYISCGGRAEVLEGVQPRCVETIDRQREVELSSW